MLVFWSAPRGFDTLVSRSPATPVPVTALPARSGAARLGFRRANTLKNIGTPGDPLPIDEKTKKILEHRGSLMKPATVRNPRLSGDPTGEPL
jgi:hypothetical protein